ncbi:MAG: hypothetical protein VX798_05955 [Bacteroidota bacterium]|nr:hypothetical protein [Bacteroidota bacterium]
MSKINIQNQQLPTSASVKYTRNDNGQTVSQMVQKKSTATTFHALRDLTKVLVHVGEKSQSITYEQGHKTLVILQEGGQNNFGLNWI